MHATPWVGAAPCGNIRTFGNWESFVKTGLLRLAALLAGVLAVALALVAAPARAAQVLDLRGRTVTVPDQVRRISIDDSRFLVALALIEPDPVKRLAAWPRDVHRIGDATYRQYLAT